MWKGFKCHWIKKQKETFHILSLNYAFAEIIIYLFITYM